MEGLRVSGVASPSMSTVGPGADRGHAPAGSEAGASPWLWRVLGGWKGSAESAGPPSTDRLTDRASGAGYGLPSISTEIVQGQSQTKPSWREHRPGADGWSAPSRPPPVQLAVHEVVHLRDVRGGTLRFQYDGDQAQRARQSPDYHKYLIVSAIRERQRKGAIVGFFIAGAIILVLALLMYFGLFPPSSSEAGATRGAVYGAFGLAGGVFVVLPLCTQYASCCRPISYERFLAGLQRHETAVRQREEEERGDYDSEGSTDEAAV